MEFNKKDALMTKGVAIISMVVLHLFCRVGEDVYGTPLLWVNDSTPFVYYFGFFAEICVYLYSICAGYAHGLIYEKAKEKKKFIGNIKRAIKLLINYWIILFIFCGLGLIFDKSGNIPGGIIEFLKSIVLLHNYNGAWWYLTTYIILLLISPILIKLFKCISVPLSVFLCVIIEVLAYFINLPQNGENEIINYIFVQLDNLWYVFASYWLGYILFRTNLIGRLRKWYYKKFEKYGNLILLITFISLFIAVNIVHKAVTMCFVAVAVFVLFNMWKKGKISNAVFCFLGEHSTNIWLTHMFFYLCLFEGLVQKALYPIPMLLFILALCIATSYVVNFIYKIIMEKILCGKLS